MFKLFSKSKEESAKIDLSPIHADMHSHLLPGIDDGSPDTATSLQLIKGLMDLGYKKLITTPHIMGDMYRNNRKNVTEKLESLRVDVKNAGMDIELNAAAEYFLDDHVAQMLRKNEPLLAISGNMILVEFSMAHPSMSIKEILFEMQMQGYLPVIAHPERYIYLERNKEFYDELKDIGCLFQMNILSLTSYYGKSVNQLAQYLIKKEYYNLIGTDLHHIHHLKELNNPALLGPVNKMIESGLIRNSEL